MSAGTVMSVPTEEFGAPPCKRQRKDEEPPNKGIKNYFSPVSRSIDKALSSPRSTNIADYFIRSPPIVDKECNRSPERPAELPASPTPLSASSRAPGRLNKQAKRTRLIRRIEDVHTKAESDGDDGNASRPAAETAGNTGFISSDTTTVPAERCSKAEDLADDDGPQSSKPRQQAIKTRLRSLKRKQGALNGLPIDLTIPADEPADLQTSLPSSNVFSDSKSTLSDSSLEVHVGNSSTGLLTISFEDFLKGQAEKDSTASGSGPHRASVDPTASGSGPHRASVDPTASGSGPHRASVDSTASGSGPHRASVDPTASGSGPHRASVDPTASGSGPHRASVDSTASRSGPHRASVDPTASVSGPHRAFVDPTASGSGPHRASVDPTASGSGPHRASVDDPDIPNAASDLDPSQQPSPKTVTIQAQVHLFPPLLESSSPTRAPTKIASIFCKKKLGEAERKDSHPISGSTNGDHVIQKRKSNVVIEEEDLELAVIDVENVEPMKAKSTAAERQQFMKAFRQAGETPKTTGKKCAGRKKDVNTNTTDEPDSQNNSENREESPDRNQGNPAENKPEEPTKALKLKQGAKKPKKVDSEKTTASSTNERRAKPKPQSHEVTETPQKSPVLRRSLRRQRSDITSTSPWTADESPALMSTPKVTPSRSKSNFYKAEVLTVPSDLESPIRMRFTRISMRISDRPRVAFSDDEVFTPGRKKVSSNAKKMIKAKQLLEKAKAIQQNIAKAEIPHRRSARQKKRLSQEHIIIDDTSKSSISQPKQVKKTNLRSLNDVLGKKAKTNSSASGPKKEVKKKVPKGAIITVDDDSETSENSQDDEQFKAKREFLMSGLPDSLKRNLAKAAALREAYALSSLSFHRVLHVQQRDGCEKWDLRMPLCPLLTRLVPASLDVPDVASITMSIGDVTSCSIPLPIQQVPAMMSRKVVFSEAIRDCLLEEIRWYNPQFPVRRFFTQFLKKHHDYLALQDTNKPGGQQADRNPTIEDALQKEENGAKRKDSSGLKSKRRKGVPVMDEPKEASASKGRKGRLPRGSLRRSAPDVIIIEEDEKAAPDADGPVWEDVLWTEKYQPQSSSELIGNSVAVRRLHSWLRDWKTRAEKEEKRNQMQRTGKDKNDTWDMEDFNDEDSDEDSLCNTMLITGPPGVGKTAAVYACAQELGFKVFEVNASGQRSGRQILAQLKEATQSHQVDQQGVNAHKPCFFSSCSLGKSPRKIHSPKTVVSSPRKPPMSPRGGKKGLAPKSLANFFKAAPKQKVEEKKAAPDQGKAASTISDGKMCANKAVKALPFMTEKGSEESQRKSATSLILFEEVDVIFDEDSGFLSAIKTFMSTTKRPVILTTSDAMFGMMFDGVFEEITFHTPSMVNVATYLQVLCLAENLRMDMKDLMTFLTANMCDIRQSVLQLQFWAHSGGGGLREKALPPPAGVNHDGTSAASKIHPKQLPGCHFGCAENMMGLGDVIPPTEGLVPYVKDNIGRAEERDRIIRLLSEFQTTNKDFISSNLEYLLPLPLCVKEDPAPCEAEELAPPTEDDHIKMSAQMKRRKKLVLLDDSDLFDSDSNERTTDGPAEESPSNVAEQSASAHSAPVRRKLTGAQLTSSCLLYTCLDSLAIFADNLSYLDCCTRQAAEQADACNQNWTESRLRPGLCDSLRIETADAMTAQSAADIRAHVEGLAFHKCSSQITKALDTSLERCCQAGHDPTQELTLHVSKSRDKVYFGQSSAATNTAQSRLSIVRTVLSNRAFTALGNRQVNVTEYLPALRSICRIEKAKEEGKTKRRFLHYLEGIHLELPKTTLNSLAADFP